MAFYDFGSLEQAVLGSRQVSGDMFVHLGLMYSTGRTVPVDRVAAHKWFNIAGARGNRDAVELRRGLAAEMSEGEIAEAQRAARIFLTTH